MSTAVEFRDVSVRISEDRKLLNDITLKLEEGSTTAVLGRSGSGKTTLLRTVNRLVELSGGAILVNDRNIDDLELIPLRRKLGYVIQETGLFPHFTIERNVGVVLEAERRPLRERLARSHQLLTAVGLDPTIFAHRFPHQLSGGQRQRVGLARALASDPDILLMDEPFGALDPLTRAEMQNMVQDLLRDLRKTVLLVTHDLDEALFLADRIVLLREGKLVANLSNQEFMKSRQPEIMNYIRAYHRGEEKIADRKGLREERI